MNKFLSPNDVAELTSLHRASIYRLISAGQFPKPIRLTKRRVAFSAEEVEAWMAERLNR